MLTGGGIRPCTENKLSTGACSHMVLMANFGGPYGWTSKKIFLELMSEFKIGGFSVWR